MLKWIKYSGLAVVFTLNPLHWRLVPQVRETVIDEWVGPHERAWFASWLFLTIRVWIDDGSW